MILSKKIRCLPTPEQLIKFKKSTGTARFVYNLMISENNKVYEEHLLNGKQGISPFISGYDFGKYVRKLKKLPEYAWLSEVGGKVATQACFDCDNAFKRFFKKLSNFPKFKKKGIKDSFYVRYDSIKVTQKGFKCEKLGEIKTSESIPKVDKYHNPRIIYDGKYIESGIYCRLGILCLHIKVRIRRKCF